MSVNGLNETVLFKNARVIDYVDQRVPVTGYLGYCLLMNVIEAGSDGLKSVWFSPQGYLCPEYASFWSDTLRADDDIGVIALRRYADFLALKGGSSKGGERVTYPRYYLSRQYRL